MVTACRRERTINLVLRAERAFVHRSCARGLSLREGLWLKLRGVKQPWCYGLRADPRESTWLCGGTSRWRESRAGFPALVVAEVARRVASWGPRLACNLRATYRSLDRVVRYIAVARLQRLQLRNERSIEWETTRSLAWSAEGDLLPKLWAVMQRTP